jgi:diacylglycerol kinase (ATP)
MSNKSKAIRVKLIGNPDAGKSSDSANNLKLVTGFLDKSGFKTDISLEKQKEKITQIAQKAIKDGYKIVIAMGGDGTTQAVMRGMIGSKSRLGIIPTGIDNFIAKRFEIPSDLEAACALIATDNIYNINVGQVKTNDREKSVFFEMVAIGLSTVIYPDTNKIAKSILSVKKDLPDAQEQKESKTKAFITLDDEPEIEIETNVVIVRNAPGFEEKIGDVPEESPQVGLLDVMVFPDFSKSEILRYFAAESDRSYKGKGKVKHLLAGKIKIRTSPKLDVMVDGVPLGKDPVMIKVIDNALQVITTKRNPISENLQKVINEIQPEPKSELSLSGDAENLIGER